MELNNNTILITGGSSGIGLELAKRLAQKNNKILICGRSQNKLEAARQSIENVEIFQCDLSSKNGCMSLVSWIRDRHETCNILINNAAITHSTNFKDDNLALEKAEAEIQTNLMAPIVLSKMLIPVLELHRNSKIINVTTGLVYAPRAIYPFYNATKSALHSFTQVLRIQLEKSSISIVEVLFPAVNTPWHKGNVPPIAISVESAAAEMILGIEKEKLEIKVGKVKLLHLIARIAPSFALRKINNISAGS